MPADTLQLIFYVLFPAFIIWAVKHSLLLKRISPIVLCYLVGIFIANIPFIHLNTSLSGTITDMAVPLAIPLLLFSTDFVKWLRFARGTMLSFALSIIGVVMGSLIAAYIFTDYTEESWKIAGMLTGTYSGGTPNMAAVGLALEVKEETFVLLNTADLLLCSIYLIFLMTVAQRVLRTFLPISKTVDAAEIPSGDNQDSIFSALKTKQKILYGIGGLMISAGVMGAAIGLSFLIQGTTTALIVILVVTTSGIAGSFIKSIRTYKGTYELGEYLLLIFCVAIGSQVNFMELFTTTSIAFYYVVAVISISIMIHYILAAVFRIDADTVIITSTAAILGPAVVGPVADTLKNRYLMVSGLTTGLLGFAIGNYLGLAVAYMLKP